MKKNLLVLDSNLFRGKCLQYRLSRDALCDYARTPETAFEQIREKLRVGGTYDVIVLPSRQRHFVQGMESIYNKFGSLDVNGPRFVVFTSSEPQDRRFTTEKHGKHVVEVSGPREVTRAALGY